METTSNDYRSSFSQHMMFCNCPRSWYWANILKIYVPSDFTHANAGTCVHKALDKYYSNGKVLEQAKEEFERQWNKFKLDNSILRLRKDEYWLMCINGININKNITTTEMKIFYPELVAYLDGVDTINDEIIDWKTSTRSEENQEEYRKQILLYSVQYKRKFGRIPRKCTIFYLKYSGSKGEMSFNFNEEHIKEIEEWYNNILQKMKYYIQHPEELPPFNHEYYFSPYREFWGSETNGKIKFILHLYGNYLQVEGPVTELLEKGIKKKFSYELKNAHWIKKARPQAKTTVEFWNSRNRILPIGFRDGLIKTLTDYVQWKKYELDLDIIDHRQFNNTILEMPDKFVNGKELRDYQIEAVDKFLRKKIGVLQLGTGAGKSEIAIEIMRKLKVKALFVVDKIELLLQTKKRIEEALGIKVGQLGQGISDIQDITVCTVQTIFKNIQQYKDYLASVRFIIFDECHHAPASSYVKLSKYLIGMEYRLGISATPTREDGNQMMIEAITGSILYNMSTDELINRGFLVPPQITFIQNYMDNNIVNQWEQQLKIGLINESKDFSKYYDRFIVDNEYRNNQVLEIVNKNKDKKILILVKLVRHGEMLNQLILESKYLYGGSNKKERKKMFEEFVNSSNKVLISTIPIWSEGIDCQSLELIINAGANVSSIKTIQMLGRTLRLNENKNKAYYYDFIDETKFFKRASYKRLKTLRNEGHEIQIIGD